MAEIKYLDLAGLGYYDGKIKSYIDTKVATATAAAAEAAKTATEYNPNITQKSAGTFEDGKLVLQLNYTDGNNTVQTADVFLPVVASYNTSNGSSGVVTKDMHDKWNTAATKADTNETNIETLTTKVDGLVTAGGEPNTIDGITIGGNAVVIENKTAKIDLKLDYSNKKIILSTADADGYTGLSEIDASDFIKDGMLESAEIIEVPGDEAATLDRPAGKYIKLTWNTDAGQDPTYIPVADLLTEYTFNAGAEATYGTDNKLGIKLTATTTTLADGTKQTTYTPTISQTGWLTNVDNTLGALNTTYAAKSHIHNQSDIDGLNDEITNIYNRIDEVEAAAVKATNLKRIENADIDALFTA